MREFDDFQATMRRSLAFFFDGCRTTAAQLDFVETSAETELQATVPVAAPASPLCVRLEDAGDGTWPVRWLVDVFARFDKEWVQLGTVSGGQLRELSVSLADYTGEGATLELGVKMRIDSETEFPNVAYNKTWLLSPGACLVSDASPKEWLPPLVAIDTQPLYFDLALGSPQFIRTAHCPRPPGAIKRPWRSSAFSYENPF
jgi:hypothetical protein